MDLIVQLKQEHIDILRLFDYLDKNINNDEMTNNEFLNNLNELKEVLIAHLDLENKLLYPKLETAKLSELKTIGENFANEMVKISKTAMDFFKEIENENLSELREKSLFKKNFSEITNVVKKRIEIEEKILFPAYELINS